MIGKIKNIYSGHSMKWHSPLTAISSQPISGQTSTFSHLCQSPNCSFFWLQPFWGCPTNIGQKVCLHTGVLKMCNGEATVIDLAISLQVGLWTFHVRSTIIYQCWIIWKVCYLFLRLFELEFSASVSAEQ